MADQLEGLYIRILEYAVEKSDEGVNVDELKDYLEENHGYKFSDLATRRRFEQMFYKIFDQLNPINIKIKKGVQKRVVLMKTEPYFHYLDYVKIKESRASSLKAENHAKIAICISIATLFISIVVSVWQLSTPIMINDNQLTEIKELKYDSTEANQSISDIKRSVDEIKEQLSKSQNK